MIPCISCSVSCIFFFISNFIDFRLLPFILMSLAKGLSTLFIFSKNLLLLSLIFAIALLVSISFISDSFICVTYEPTFIIVHVNVQYSKNYWLSFPH